MMERWEPILEGRYAVSSLGCIRRIKSGRILKTVPNSHGYLMFTGCVRGSQKMVRVHRVVALAFLGNPPDGHEVNHKNGIKTDNRAENLEWVTRRENHRHAASLGLRAIGERNGAAKLTPQDVVGIRIALKSGLSKAEIGRLFGIAGQSVTCIATGKLWGWLR